jgi:hypothetical protein
MELGIYLSMLAIFPKFILAPLVEYKKSITLPSIDFTNGVLNYTHKAHWAQK